jgi:hypothetical protein
MKKYRWLIYSSIVLVAIVAIFMIFSNNKVNTVTYDTASTSTPSPAVGSNEQYKNDWRRYITVQLNSGYKTGFGGFKDLTLLVNNYLPYKVEHLQVKINYIKAKGDSYKTETVNVYNLDPNNPKIIRAPESRRGVRLQISVTGISCSELQLVD